MTQPEEDRRLETSQPAGAGQAGIARAVRETSGPVFWGVWKMLIVILAAFMGAMFVEALRAIL